MCEKIYLEDSIPEYSIIDYFNNIIILLITINITNIFRRQYTARQLLISFIKLILIIILI